MKYKNLFKKDLPVINKDYKVLLQDIKAILEKTKYRVYQAVDNLKVQTYWQIGERIVRDEIKYKNRADYGKKIIENLAADLRITRQQLAKIVQFYRAYPIVTALRRQLSWTHYEVLIPLSKEKREFYELKTMQNIWSTRAMEKQIKADLFKKCSGTGQVMINQQAFPEVSEKIFKDVYDFDFIKLGDNYTEKDVEDTLVRNVESLLYEFGKDFSLAGRQRKLLIDNQIHTVDLEFFHRGIPCIVLADIKIGLFKSEYVGQMNKYLNYYRENRKCSWEKDPIGLIVCENKGEEEVHYALGRVENRIFVAEYKKKLPTEKEIKQKLIKIKNLSKEK